MPGRPITRARFAALAAIEDEIMDRLGAGEFVTHLVKELATSPDYPDLNGIGTTTFYDFINDDPERRERFYRVRADSAHAHVEKSFDVLEDARKEGRSLTAAQSAIVRSQSDSHRWIAGKLNREYSDKIQVEHGADVEDWKQVVDHINANLARLAAGDGETIAEADYELLESESQTEGNDDE